MDSLILVCFTLLVCYLQFRLWKAEALLDRASVCLLDIDNGLAIEIDEFLE